ncbi:unnamed protein product, partial [Iphiclides podalirius]
MHKLFRYFDDGVDFKDYWELLKKDLIFHTPLEEQVREALEQRNHPNMMFLLYEEMQKDLLGVIDKVCSFLGKEYTKQQKEELKEHLKFDNMNKMPPFSTPKAQGNDSELKFMRKGKSGNWVQYFDVEMKKEAEEYMNKYLDCTKLQFPEIRIGS